MPILASPMSAGSLHRLLLFAALLPLSTAATGCSGIPMTDEAAGTTHHLILGFGIISVPGPESAKTVSAVRLHSVGLAVGTGPAGGLALGYKSATAVVADKDASAHVEIASGAFGPMSVGTTAPLTGPENEKDQ